MSIIKAFTFLIFLCLLFPSEVIGKTCTRRFYSPYIPDVDYRWRGSLGRYSPSLSGTPYAFTHHFYGEVYYDVDGRLVWKPDGKSFHLLHYQYTSATKPPSTVQQLTGGDFNFPGSIFGFSSMASSGYQITDSCYPDWKGDPDNPDEDPWDESDFFGYVIWIDYYRHKEGILFGLFGSRPEGCQALGAKVPKEEWIYDLEDINQSDRFTGNFSSAEIQIGLSESTFRSYKGSALLPLTQQNKNLLSQLPYRFNHPNYHEVYFKALWINPQCYWSPGGGNIFSPGSSFDFLWDILLFWRKS